MGVTQVNYDKFQTNDWTGCLVKIKKEWMTEGERDIPYLVVEDRGNRVLVQELKEYSKTIILGIWCWSKDWCYIIDMDARNGEVKQYDTDN